MSLQINSKDMRSCRHEDAVAMLTGGLSYVTLIVYREKIINKRMTPLSKLQDQSVVNKKLLIKNEVINLVEFYIRARAVFFSAQVAHQLFWG